MNIINSFARYNALNRKILLKTIDRVNFMYSKQILKNEDKTLINPIRYCCKCFSKMSVENVVKCRRCNSNFCRDMCFLKHHSCSSCFKCNLSGQYTICSKCDVYLCDTCATKSSCTICATIHCIKCIKECCRCKKMICKKCCDRCLFCEGVMCANCSKNLSTCK